MIDQPGVFVPPTMFVSGAGGWPRDRCVDDRVVMDPPAFRQDLRFFERVEQLAIQKLHPYPAIKGFDIAVLTRRAWLDEQRRDGAIGDVTNNIAEYRAAIEGLKRASKHGIDEIELRMDSELVVTQLQGVYQVKNATLKNPCGPSYGDC